MPFATATTARKGNPVMDTFYSTFTGGVLSGLVVSRG